MTDTERKAFEEWAHARKWSTVRYIDGSDQLEYVAKGVDAAWQAWLARAERDK